MTVTQSQDPQMKKFYSPEYGFLHACNKDGTLWYNLTDICNTLAMKLREAESHVKNSKGKVNEFNVRRQKVTSCNRYVDQDGLLTVLIESRKNTSNGYRKWIESVVTHSLLHPDQSQELDEITPDCSMTSYEVRIAYIEQAKKKRSTVQQTTSPKKQSQKQQTLKISETPEPFVPDDGHMTIEEFFRKEMSFTEFKSNLDNVLKCARQYIRTLSRKQQSEAQHSVNVMTTFRGMLKANEKNLIFTQAVACL